MISFCQRPDTETKEEFYKHYPDPINSFPNKHQQVCYAYYKHNENSHCMGTIDADPKIFKKIVGWIHKQSNNNITITIFEEKTLTPVTPTNRMLFKLEVSRAYTPLSRHITTYLALVTLRMSDVFENYVEVFKEKEFEEFSGFLWMVLNDYAIVHRSQNHSMFCCVTKGLDEISLPEEVYDALFNTEIHNAAFSEDFSEYYYNISIPPRSFYLKTRPSQTASLLRLCRHLKLLEKLLEINLKDYGEFEKKIHFEKSKRPSTIVESFDTGRRVNKMSFEKLNLKDPFYTEPKNKFGIGEEL
jgi:hypothetical protein